MTMQADEDWLRTLKFPSHGDLLVDGFFGQGAEKVTFHGVTPDGKEVALAHLKPHLGYYIREIPPEITMSQMYKLDILNEKLAALVGDPLIDQASYSSNRLHAGLARLIWDNNLASVLLKATTNINLLESIPCITGSIGFRLRVEDWSMLQPDKKLPFLSVNHPFVHAYPVDAYTR